MGQRIHRLDPEQRLRAQPGNADGALSPSAAPKAPHPGRRTAGTAHRPRSRSRSASPSAAPTCVAPRQKMPPIIAGRNCATPTKAIRPDGGQRGRAAGEVIIAVAHRQHRPRSTARRAFSTSAAQIGRHRRRRAQPQPDRHHDMVRHHGGQRNRLDDHHRGGAGKAAQKGQHRQPALPLRTTAASARTCRGWHLAGSRSSPITAIGTMKRLIASR